MRQNLANRLAGGGFWALRSALYCVNGVREMREHNMSHPAVKFSDRQVLTYAAVGAFNLFVNVNLDDMVIQFELEEVAPDPQFANKYGQPITQEAWAGLQRDPDYKWIANWRNGIDAVCTAWIGVDTEGCTPPHIFATAVVRYTNDEPEVQHTFRTTCLADAREAHRQTIELLRQGRL